MPSSLAPNEHGPTAGSDASTTGRIHRALPDLPGEDSFTHQGRIWIEAAEATLAGAGLLRVAKGHPPASAEQIIDIDDLPELPAGHRDFERRKEYRMKAKTHNAANEQKRIEIILSSWTELYTCMPCSRRARSARPRC